MLLGVAVVQVQGSSWKPSAAGSLGDTSEKYMRTAALDHRARAQWLRPDAALAENAQDGPPPEPAEVPAKSNATKPKRLLKEACGQPLLLSGRSLDVVITFWTSEPEPTSAAFLKGTSAYYSGLVFALRGMERYGLLSRVRTVHILMDENVWARDGAPRALLFNQTKTALQQAQVELKLVLDAQIGVYFHQGSAKWSALAKIPNVADWIFYLPDDVLLMDNFTMDDFWDGHFQKPKMYAYDQSAAGWCDGGPPVGSFRGPVLLNRCFLQEVAARYSDASYLPHSWVRNQVQNMGPHNIDSICLYTKAVLEEGVALDGGTPAWNRQCHMGLEAGSEACSADELLGIPLQTPRAKFVKVADAKLGNAWKDLGATQQGSADEEAHACEQLKTRMFFRDVAGSVPMSLEARIAADLAGNGTSIEDPERWPILCFATPLSGTVARAASSISAAAMLLMLCLSLAGLLWAHRSRFQNASKGELLANGCVLLYIVLTVVIDVLIRRFHQEGLDTYKFSPAVVVFFIEVGKLLISGIMALVDWKHTRECSSRELGSTLLLMVVPAACYVFLNLGRYLALSGADLDEYRVWRSTDIIFVAILWFTMFRTKPKPKQVYGIALVFVACALMSLQDLTVSMRVTSSVLSILGLAFVSSLGLVTNELGLKGSANLSIFVQNFALYLVTCTLNGIFVVCTVARKDMLQGIEGPQLLVIVLDVCLGLCVACVLKYANAMIKQLASGWLAPLEPLVGHFTVGTAVTPVMVLATLCAGAGSIVYRLESDPEPAEK